MSNATVPATRVLAEDEIDARLQAMADAFGSLSRSPIMHSPAEYDLDFQDVTFPSWDGVPLDGWYIPAKESGRLVIANHPMGFSRAGLPAHLDPWRSAWAPSGNDVEVDFVPDYRILHDAGYDVLAYDLRNFGHSGAGNGGIGSSGIFESRDVLGSLRYVRERPDLHQRAVGLFSRCLGANATFYAMTTHPEMFGDVRCLLAPQPLTTRVISARQLALAGVPAERIDDLERRIVLKTGIDFSRREPTEWAKHVCVPTFLYQVRDDVLTEPEDVQSMFDNIPVADKDLQWIDGTTARFDGYLEFQRRPAPMLDWLTHRMA